MPKCTRCTQTKPQTEFYPKADLRSGVRPVCKECSKQYSRASYEAGKERARYREPLAEHTCSRCHEIKPTSEFAANPRYKSGLASYCRDCHRVYQRIRHYNITEDDLQKMFDEQHGLCAACGAGLDIRGSATHVDHCHVTGNVRGLLCRPCNVALGCVKDNPVTLQRMIAYLAASVD